MKKIFLSTLLLVSVVVMNAQEAVNPQATNSKNEITSNLFDLVTAGSFNITYDRLFENNQALSLSATFFDTYGYVDVGYIEDNSAFTFEAAYKIYFSSHKEHAGFFFYPLLKVRTGEITVDDYGYYNFDGEFINEEYTYDLGGFSAGFGLGHQWVFNDKFTLGVNGDIARSLGNFDTDYLGEVEFKFGVNFGVRF